MRLPFLILLLSIAAMPALAADLSIRVEGLRSGAGEVHYAVYSEPQHFAKPQGRVAKGIVKAHRDGVVIVIRGLATGTYAVAVFHDENGNGEFDQGFFGIPLEDYGFSNDALAFLGPPSFSDAAFALRTEGGHITVRLGE